MGQGLAKEPRNKDQQRQNRTNCVFGSLAHKAKSARLRSVCPKFPIIRMTQPGGRDFGGNSSVVASPTQAGATAGTFTGGPVSGAGVIATGTGTGSAVNATSSGTGAAIVATNAGTGEAAKIIGDTASTTAVMASLFIAPIQNQPSGAHVVGHVWMSAAGKLMVCVGAGTPGTHTVVGLQT